MTNRPATDTAFHDATVGLTTYIGRVEECQWCGETHDWHVDITHRPSGPEDKSPKPTRTLSHTDLRALVKIAGDHRYGIGLADEGDAYTTVLLYDAEGRVTEARLVFPDGGIGKGLEERG